MEIRGASLVLKDATLAQAPELLAVLNEDKQFNRENGNPLFGSTLQEVSLEMLEMQKLDHGTIWSILTQTGLQVGFAGTALFPYTGTAWISLLLIKSQLRKQGYGSEVAALLETYFFSLFDVTYVEVIVPSHNIQVRKFWKNRGYSAELWCTSYKSYDVYSYRLSHSSYQLRTK